VLLAACCYGLLLQGLGLSDQNGLKGLGLRKTLNHLLFVWICCCCLLLLLAGAACCLLLWVAITRFGFKSLGLKTKVDLCSTGWGPKTEGRFWVEGCFCIHQPLAMQRQKAIMNKCMVGIWHYNDFAGRSHEITILTAAHVEEQFEALKNILVCQEHKTWKEYGDVGNTMPGPWGN